VKGEKPSSLIKAGRYKLINKTGAKSFENDEESSLVDKKVEISNLDLIQDMVRIVGLKEVFFNNK
jgi:hypothetical protein